LKLIGFLAVIATGVMLLFAVADFPDWADPESPASLHVSPYYITKTIEDTSVPNVVTTVLADYRGFDTMFETVVIFSAGIAVLALLGIRRRPGAPAGREETHVPPPHQSLVVQTVCRVIVPFMQLYALYVLAHGHHSPGGGFQGGVILGASFILMALSYDLKMMIGRISRRTVIIMGSVGIFIYSGTGALALLMGGNFLDYGTLHPLMPATDAIGARSHGMLLVEIGVAVAVMAIMIIIYSSIASRGRYDRGL